MGYLCRIFVRLHQIYLTSCGGELDRVDASKLAWKRETKLQDQQPTFHFGFDSSYIGNQDGSECHSFSIYSEYVQLISILTLTKQRLRHHYCCLS